MSLVVVHPAAQHAAARPWVGVLASAPHARCTQSFVPSAVSRRKSHSCPRMIVPTIATPATTKSGSHATNPCVLLFLLFQSVVNKLILCELFFHGKAICKVLLGRTSIL